MYTVVLVRCKPLVHRTYSAHAYHMHQIVNLIGQPQRETPWILPEQHPQSWSSHLAVSRKERDLRNFSALASGSTDCHSQESNTARIFAQTTVLAIDRPPLREKLLEWQENTTNCLLPLETPTPVNTKSLGVFPPPQPLVQAHCTCGGLGGPLIASGIAFRGWIAAFSTRKGPDGPEGHWTRVLVGLG